jgi:hypothetical protein
MAIDFSKYPKHWLDMDEDGFFLAKMQHQYELSSSDKEVDVAELVDDQGQPIDPNDPNWG